MKKLFLGFLIFFISIIKVNAASNCDFTFCSDSGVLTVFNVLGVLLFFAKIFVPLVLIIIAIIDFSKAMLEQNDDGVKNATNIGAKRVIAGIIIFFIPAILNIVFNLFNSYVVNQNEHTSCQECILNPFGNECTLSIEQAKRDQISCNNNSNQSDIIPPTNDSENNNNNNGNNTPSVSREYTAYLGDSRTNGLKLHALPPTGNNEVYAIDGGTINDFYTHIDSLKQQLNSNPAHAYNIVLNYGVNDLGNVSKYVSEYQSFINSIDSKHQIILVSVNPVNDNSSPYAKNTNIESFNNTIKSSVTGSNVKYCDVYNSTPLSTWISNYISSDGIHYTGAGYNYIYNQIEKCLN